MAQLLRIDSSSRIEDSQSRTLADMVEARWRAAHPDGHVTLRDLAAEPLPPIAAETIAGFFTAPGDLTEPLRAATALSDRLIDELMAADTVLISAPMYNFSIPSALKAYIDQVVRVGKTFSFDETGFAGLVTGKQAIVATAYGAAGYLDGDLAAMNFLQPYLGALLGFLGFSEVDFVAIEGTTTDAQALARTTETAKARIETLIAA